MQIKIEEDGFFELVIGGASQRLDLIRCNNQIYQAQVEHQDKTEVEIADAQAVIVESWGFPRPSHRALNAIKEHMRRLMEAELGKGEPAPEATTSPA